MTERGRAEQITAMGTVATAIGVAIVAMQSRKVSADGTPATEVLARLDEETLALLIALAATVDRIEGLVADLEAAIQQLNVEVQGFPANCPTIFTWNITVGAGFVPLQLPSVPIPEGFQLVVKSSPNNAAGTVMYIGKSAPDAGNPNAAWPLAINESLGLAITNCSLLWVAANVASTLCCVVEQRV